MKYLPLSILINSILLPIFSVIGCIYIRNGNNIFSIFVILYIVVIYIYLIFSNELPDIYYVIILFSISISLLLQSSFISDYIVGYDMNVEYQVYQYTLKNSYWGELLYENQNILNYNSVLSVTVLPTMLKLITMMDDDFIFKFIYPLIFSFLVVNLYMCNKCIMNNSKDAFICSLLFMAPISFSSVEMISLGKQMIAMSILSSILYILIKNRSFSKKILIIFIILNFGIIMSHYSILFISIYVMSVYVIYNNIYVIKKHYNYTIFILILVISILWYLYVSNSSSPIYYLFKNIFQITEFNIKESYAINLPNVMFGSTLRSMGAIIFYLIQGIIFLGFLYITKKHKNYSNYYPISLAGITLIISALIVPKLGDSLMITRFYQISMMFISTLYIFGYKWVSQKFFKLNKYQIQFLSSFIIIIFFIFQTGFIYELAGDTQGLTRRGLSLPRIDERELYIAITNDWDVISATWLSKYVSEEMKISIYSDAIAMRHVLASYGLIPPNYERILSNNTIINYGYIYLTNFNIRYQTVITRKGGMSRVSESFNEYEMYDKNLIFSNGGSKILFVPREFM